MAINIRTKGATGERDVIKLLIPALTRALDTIGCVGEDRARFLRVLQRNQMQTAVGGNDLAGTFGLSIEVKRQEQLAINTWWAQCCKSAAALDEVPVLIYRQNHKPWRVVLYTRINLPDGGYTLSRGEIHIEDFLLWFETWARIKILQGWRPQS